VSAVAPNAVDRAIAGGSATGRFRAVERSGGALYWSFLVCLAVVSLPIKNLAYLAPLVYLALQFRTGNYRLLGRTAVLMSVVATVSLISIVWDSLRLQQVNLPGVAVGLLTHLPLLIVLCERYDRTIDDALFRRFVDLCSWFVLVQSAIGLAQFAAFGNPDSVCGTYGLLDGMHGTITISQVYFTFTIFGMLLFLLSEIRRPLVAASFAAGLLTCAVAQSGHQTIFLAVALGVCGFVGVVRLRIILLGGVLVAALAGFVFIFYPETYELSYEWYQKVVVHPDSPKRIVVDGGWTVLGDAKNALLGAGLGQYCSRAALITSNTYLSADLPTLLTGQSDYFAAYVQEGRSVFAHVGEGSAISKPYFSILSLLTELGPLLCLPLAAAVGIALKRNHRSTRSKLPDVATMGFAANVGIVFFLLCCLVENYAELPQAVFLPLLLYVVALSRMRTRRRNDSGNPNRAGAR